MTVTGVETPESPLFLKVADLGMSMEGPLPDFFRFCSLLSSLSSSQAKSVRFSLVFARTSPPACALALISLSALGSRSCPVTGLPYHICWRTCGHPYFDLAWLWFGVLVFLPSLNSAKVQLGVYIFHAIVGRLEVLQDQSTCRTKLLLSLCVKNAAANVC